ncbi:sugar phosphate isomerase/epimerase family protein [Stutzerimonas tarimensis]|uniref:Sugar phosphate isomerase/epimerase family protein n=1 Tax=Stutzerimonas tarimensis TaxID=1507735 RepID=A0ABV7T1Q4_9GAMM
MRLAISNIAWDVAEDEAVANLLQRFDVDAIDVAPGKYFPDLHQAREVDMKAVRTWWSDRGIELTGMQSLLFGTQGLNLFDSPQVQHAMLEHLGAVCRVGAGLGATRLVFGSPKNRDRQGLDDEQTLEMATAFFTQVGDIALTEGVQICLEPNPTCYGANFMVDSSETERVVRAINHPAIAMQFDTGALTINDEQPDAVLERAAGLIGHVHASEPNLVPLGDGGTDHARMAAALARHLSGKLVSIEMVATRDEPHLAAIERALAVADRCYRNAL